MKTTKDERTTLRLVCSQDSDVVDLLDDIDELLAERKTLRDEFAMAALTGLVSQHTETRDSFAAEAYHFADAMLAARSATKEE